jgi:RNA polymerase sigma factor (sigma-70 family)
LLLSIERLEKAYNQLDENSLSFGNFVPMRILSSSGKVSDKDIVEGIQRNKPQIIEYLYQKFYPWVLSYVHRNSGNRQDAEDVYQEALFVICKKIHDDDLRLTSSFKTFLISICINQWRVRLYEMRKKPVEYNDSLVADESPKDSLDIEIRKIEQYKLYLKHFNKLSKACREILKLHGKDLSFEEIKIELELRTIGAARKRKFDCKEKLLKMIKSDPMFEHLKDREYES